MRALRAFSLRLGGLFSRNRRDRDLAAELEAHVQLDVDEGVAHGLTPQEARRRALLRLGGLEATKEKYRDRLGFPLIDTLAADLRQALRSLRKRPGFACVAIVSLALGIGANSAMFSLVHAVILRPLPFPEAERLVRVCQPRTCGDVTLAEYDFLKARGGAFASVAGNEGLLNRRLVHDDGSVDIWTRALPVTPGFFRTLGVPLAAGHEFTTQDATRGAAPAVILSDEIWRGSFGSDLAVTGKAVTLDGTTFTVIGVASPGFWFPQKADLFIPLGSTGGPGDLGAKTELIGRLKPNTDPKQAEAELRLISGQFGSDHAAVFDGSYRGLTALSYKEWLVGDTGRKLVLLLGAVGLLLLIACLNLAGLLLARTASRQSEIAVRLALGSSRGRLLQQFVVENMLIGVAGAGAGLIAAWWLLNGFLAFVPFEIPLSIRPGVDGMMLLFTALIALGMVLFVSLVPFLMAARLPLYQTLKGALRSTDGAGERRGVRDLMVMCEVAISATLLVGAALLTQSLYRLSRQSLGFTPDNVVTFWTPPAFTGPRSGERLLVLQSRLLEQLQAIPGVQNVAAINVIPLDGKNNFPAQRDNHPEQSIGGMEIRLITPGYFETMRIPLRRGRVFNSRDTADSAPVVLVNEALAREWWPLANPIGDRIAVGKLRERVFIDEKLREVAGVVADTKTVLLTEAARPTLYLPASQASWSTGGMSWVVRGKLSSALDEAIRRRVRQVAPEQRIERLRPLNSIVAATTYGTRFDATLYGTFAGLALFVSAIGVYGLLSWAVARRTAEIGLHIALGATRGKVIWLILRQGVRPVIGGIVPGLAGGFALSRSLSSMLYGVRPTDPSSLIAVAVLLLAVGCLAGYLPARRAAGVDPVVALRAD